MRSAVARPVRSREKNKSRFRFECPLFAAIRVERVDLLSTGEIDRAHRLPEQASWFVIARHEPHFFFPSGSVRKAYHPKIT
jgi:hypothetical protein